MSLTRRGSPSSKVRWAIVLAAALVLGCATHRSSASPGAPPPAETQGAQEPPTSKQVLQYFLRNQDVPLSIDPSCKGVGTSFEDKTIGDYAAGFLAELTDGKNEIAASCQEGSKRDGVLETWACEIEWRHQLDEEVWSWGLRFSVRASDGVFLRDSVRCIGGG